MIRAVLTLALLGAGPALAQDAPIQPKMQQLPIACGPVTNIAANLAGRYQEKPYGVGATDGGQFVLTVNPTTHSWTVLLLRPDGIEACLLAAGENWKLVQ